MIAGLLHLLSGKPKTCLQRLYHPAQTLAVLYKQARRGFADGETLFQKKPEFYITGHEEKNFCVLNRYVLFS